MHVHHPRNELTGGPDYSFTYVAGGSYLSSVFYAIDILQGVHALKALRSLQEQFHDFKMDIARLYQRLIRKSETLR